MLSCFGGKKRSKRKKEELNHAKVIVSANITTNSTAPTTTTTAAFPFTKPEDDNLLVIAPITPNLLDTLLTNSQNNNDLAITSTGKKSTRLSVKSTDPNKTVYKRTNSRTKSRSGKRQQNYDYRTTLEHEKLVDLSGEFREMLEASTIHPRDIEGNEEVLLKCFHAESRKRLADQAREKAAKKQNTTKTKSLDPYSPPYRVPILERNPQKDFTSLYRIGNGLFGDTYTAKLKENKTKVAVKVMKRNFINDIDVLATEIPNLVNCTHKNLVSYQRSYLYKDKIWILTEYCSGGSLRQLLSETDLSEPIIAYISRAVLEGLEYLHSMNRVHRDIRSENIMLNIDGEVKIANLAHAAQTAGDDENCLGAIDELFNASYEMSPEAIKSDAYDSKVDIWGLGCLIHEMTDKHTPYYRAPRLKAMFKAATVGAPPTKKRNKKLSEELLRFKKKCLAVDPKDRPSAAELLNDPFLQKACSNKELIQAIELVFLGMNITVLRCE